MYIFSSNTFIWVLNRSVLCESIILFKFWSDVVAPRSILPMSHCIFIYFYFLVLILIIFYYYYFFIQLFVTPIY